MKNWDSGFPVSPWSDRGSVNDGQLGLCHRQPATDRWGCTPTFRVEQKMKRWARAHVPLAAWTLVDPVIGPMARGIQRCAPVCAGMLSGPMDAAAVSMRCRFGKDIGLLGGAARTVLTVGVAGGRRWARDDAV